ncbi:hypothetical protein LJC32_01310 [Oscillospiraceae bacterium OttesenSCG-928-F05]|nr:hypothetical protein [Oscillospiraceae bacterium OttesenSCG-928-F05]
MKEFLQKHPFYPGVSNLIRVTARHEDDYLIAKMLHPYSDAHQPAVAERLAIVYLMACHGINIWNLESMNTALQNPQDLDDADYEDAAAKAIAIRKTLVAFGALDRDETNEEVYDFLKYLSAIALDVESLMPAVYPSSNIRYLVSIEFLINGEILVFPVSPEYYEDADKHLWNEFEAAVAKRITAHYQKWKQLRDKKIPTCTIQELDLPIRTYKCLLRAGIKTVEDLSQCSAEDLSKVRNIGRKGHEHLLEVCETFRIPLALKDHTDIDEGE